MIALMVLVTAAGLAALVWLAASALGVLLTTALVVVLLVAVLGFAAVRLARSFAETRRWGHQHVKGSTARLCDSRRTTFVDAVEVALEEDEELSQAHSAQDAKLIAARRSGRIENEVAR